MKQGVPDQWNNSLPFRDSKKLNWSVIVNEFSKFINIRMYNYFPAEKNVTPEREFQIGCKETSGRPCKNHREAISIQDVKPPHTKNPR